MHYKKNWKLINLDWINRILAVCCLFAVIATCIHGNTIELYSLYYSLCLLLIYFSTQRFAVQTWTCFIICTFFWIFCANVLCSCVRQLHNVICLLNFCASWLKVLAVFISLTYVHIVCHASLVFWFALRSLKSQTIVTFLHCYILPLNSFCKFSKQIIRQDICFFHTIKLIRNKYLHTAVFTIRLHPWTTMNYYELQHKLKLQLKTHSEIGSVSLYWTRKMHVICFCLLSRKWS